MSLGSKPNLSSDSSITSSTLVSFVTGMIWYVSLTLETEARGVRNRQEDPLNLVSVTQVDSLQLSRVDADGAFVRIRRPKAHHDARSLALPPRQTGNRHEVPQFSVALFCCGTQGGRRRGRQVRRCSSRGREPKIASRWQVCVRESERKEEDALE